TTARARDRDRGLAVLALVAAELPPGGVASRRRRPLTSHLALPASANLNRLTSKSADRCALEDAPSRHLRDRDRGDQRGAVEDLLDVLLGADQLKSGRAGGEEVDRHQGADWVDAARLDRRRTEENSRVGGQDQGAARCRVDGAVGARVGD